MTLYLSDVEFVVKNIAETAVSHEREFGDLDSVVGDGDLGYSLARGFEIVLRDWESFDRTDIGTFLQRIALVITSRIGGTSGPLWGTAFLRAGAVVKGETEISASQVPEMLHAAIEGIMARGNSKIGDKTLLDVLVPMTDEAERLIAENTPAPDMIPALAVVARNAAVATTPMLARRGRASYTGERSIGSPDAGAVAVAVITEELAKAWGTRSA